MVGYELVSNFISISLWQIFLENNGGAKDRQDVLTGMVYEHKDYLFFKPQSFRDFLKTKRFNKMSDSHMFKVFSEFKSTSTFYRLYATINFSFKYINEVTIHELFNAKWSTVPYLGYGRLFVTRKSSNFGN